MLAVALLAALLTQDDLAARLRELDARVLPAEQPRMISRDARARIELANQRESDAWAGIQNKEDWERYRDARILALRTSLGVDDPPKALGEKVTKTLPGEGYVIENLVFESRPGLFVTANLYAPAPARESMPGILIVHSHHNPKTQGELQDMGVTWARLGCVVLVMDQLGHGERRQHPFVDASSYPGSFKPGRQDYYFRHITGLQLQVAGQSLTGWMVRDLLTGVDRLLARPGIDKNRIVLLGSVAGGGDPAAVAAALDRRIAAVVPFNFGGPQPETTYPLPGNAESSFNYAGSGSWEPTRNLPLSARDGFLPWVIVGSVAPRKLIYGHEFEWDRDRDPVWKRFEKIFSAYDAAGNLAATKGRGSVKGQAPESTHCNNIGPVHRRGIYPQFRKWFDIPEPEKEAQERRPAAELACLTPDFKPRLAHEILFERTTGRPGRGREALVQEWSALLPEATPAAAPKVTLSESLKLGSVAVERLVLETQPGIVVPAILLLPAGAAGTKLPVVIGIAQAGKQEFLKKRAEEIAAILKGGAAVCLPDLRGTGETRPGDGRGRGSESTAVAATELMLGRTLVGLRVHDLRSVMRHLRSRDDLKRDRIALWGDSFAPPNPPELRVEVPLDADKPPGLAEPLGGLVAFLAGLLEEESPVVCVRGGLVNYRSILSSPFCYVPYDAIIPGAIAPGDLPNIGTALQGVVRLEAMVDGLNRAVPIERMKELYGEKRVASDEKLPDWLLRALR